LNLELFIARKILSGNNHANISKPIIKIAKIAIAISVAMMILSVAIVTGFKSTIRNKVIGFGAHLQIVNYEINSSYEMSPINKDISCIPGIKKLAEVKHTQVFAIKSGIIKTKDKVQGVVIKGVGSDFDWSFFQEHLIEGSVFKVKDDSATTKVVISKYFANLLNLKVGQTFTTSFIPKSTSENIRYRVFKVSGIYCTNLEEFDKKMILADIAHVQKLNNWKSKQIGGYEISIHDFDKLQTMTEKVQDEIGYGFQPDGSKLRLQSIVELNPQIFDWLSLLDMNVWVILILMILVAGMNMISGLLVIILEKTNMIGILKSLGAKNVSIRKIFLYNAAFVVGWGLFWGNILGIGICVVQYYFRIMPLNAESYFISYVPINLQIMQILLVNIGTLIATVAMLLLPSYIITGISPAAAIKFE
jgi:lipoprotein-releasing system permease protein